MIDLRPLHRRALNAATPLLGRIQPSDLTHPTPCGDWNLQTLIAHIIGQNHGFAEAVEGSAIGSDAPQAAFAHRQLAPDGIGAAWQESADRLADAFAASPLERRTLLIEISPEIRFPVGTVVGFHLLDTVVHTWDVATALGTDFRPDDDLVEATLTQARRVPDGPARNRPGAAFAPSLPAAADDWSTALALLGRTS